MAKPQKIRVTLDAANEVEMVEVMLKDEWVPTTKGQCKDGACDVSKGDDTVIRVGKPAEPNSCIHDDRCETPPDKCSIWVGWCYEYSCS